MCGTRRASLAGSRTRPRQSRQLSRSHAAGLTVPSSCPPSALQGSPDAPRCGFSARVVGTLRGLGVPFGHFDILEDQRVREGMKVRAAAAVVSIPLMACQAACTWTMVLRMHIGCAAR